LTQRYETMDTSELGLGYRTSRFKKSSESHLVIVDVLLKLSEQFVPNIDYQGVAQSISVDPASGSNVTASEVRSAVLKLRASKLPNPDKVGNVGSFFQNPVVTDGEARRLSRLGLQIWEGSAGTKISAAQLIEQSGLKGQGMGGARVSKRHSLVLENAGDATYQDVVQLMRHVQDTVLQRFGVSLTPEPRIFPIDL
jgi:UDP-N-acetylmuramate dehydrogenase